MGPDRLPPGPQHFREEHWNRYQLETERGYRQGGWAPGHRPFRALPGAEAAGAAECHAVAHGDRQNSSKMVSF